MKPIQYIKYVEKRKVVDIPIKKILLTEQIHTNEESIQREKNYSKAYSNYLIVVRKIDNGNYSLVLGWRDFITARNNGEETIPCIVTSMTREAYINLIDKKIAKLADIANEISQSVTGQFKKVNKIGIRKGYRIKKIAAYKVRREVQYLLNNKSFSGPITLEKPTRELCEGYPRYVAAVLMGISVIPIQYKERTESDEKQ